MRYKDVHARVAQGWRRFRGIPAAVRSGTMPVPRILQPGGLSPSRLRGLRLPLGGLRYAFLLLPGLAALVIVYVFQGLTSVSAASTAAIEQQGAPESASFVAAAAAGLPTPTTGTRVPVTPYGVAGASALTASGIPEAARRAYQNAALLLAASQPSCGVPWSVLAGLGRVESNHGRFAGSSIGADGVVTPPILGIRLDGSRPGTARISDTDDGRYDGDATIDRAVGPMQFLPGTWKLYGAGGNPQDMNAAALAAARYLCAGGGDLRTQPGRWAAVYRYNHSDSYVSLVLSLADSYATGSPVVFPSRPDGTRTGDGEAATPSGKPAAVPPPAVARPGATRSPTTVPTTSRPGPATATIAPTATTSPSAAGPSPVAGPSVTTVPPVPATSASVTPGPSVTPTAAPAAG